MKSVISRKPQCTFQGVYGILVVEGRTLEGTFVYVRSIIHSWIKKKFPEINVPENAANYNVNNDSISIDIFSTNDIYSIKTSHPDNEDAGKTWITQATLCKEGKRLKIAVQNAYASIDTGIEENYDYKNYSAPGFVFDILRKTCLVDAGERMGHAVCVGSEEDLRNLIDLIRSQSRRMPVVIISQLFNKKDPLVWLYQTEDKYLLDGDKLADELNLIAHVWYLPEEYQKLFYESMPDYGVYNGAVRTFYSGFTDNDEYYHHPILIPNKIMAMDYVNLEGKEYIGGHAFRHILAHLIKERNMSNRFDWEGLQIGFYSDYNRRRILDDLTKRKESVEMSSLLEEDNERLRADITQYEKMLEEYDRDIKSLKEDLESRKRENALLKSINANNQDRISQLMDGQRDYVFRELPKDYETLADWINKNYAGRIVLHQRAKKGIKNAVFSDIKLLCQAVDCLGSDYYDMKLGKIRPEEYKCRLSKLHLEDSLTISDSSAGEYKEQYNVTVEGKKHKLDRHIKYGVSRDPRECLRIYYYWDDESNMIVIGNMPAHLENRYS